MVLCDFRFEQSCFPCGQPFDIHNRERFFAQAMKQKAAFKSDLLLFFEERDVKKHYRTTNKGIIQNRSFGFQKEAVKNEEQKNKESNFCEKAGFGRYNFFFSLGNKQLKGTDRKGVIPREEWIRKLLLFSGHLYATFATWDLRNSLQRKL